MFDDLSWKSKTELSESFPALVYEDAHTRWADVEALAVTSRVVLPESKQGMAQVGESEQILVEDSIVW